VEIIDAAGRFVDPDESGAEYVEHLRRADLSARTYTLLMSDETTPVTTFTAIATMSGSRPVIPS